MNDPLNPQQTDENGKPVTYSPLTPADKPQSHWRHWHLPVLLLLAIGSWLIITRHNAPAPFQKIEGAVFGTFYHVTYQAKEPLQKEVEAELQRVDQSLSMFNPQSTLSRINRGEETQADSMLRHVFALSQKVSEATEGAFDITVAPLVNAWGFGFKNGALPTDREVDSLLQFVGWKGITMTADGHIVKADPRMVLDCGAVAKGFGVDVVAALLRKRGVKNFMVEIGGEVIVSGLNPKGEAWRVGVNKPTPDAETGQTELETILTLSDCAMATSGNYRNFYVTPEGQRVAHTIDPHTGHPVQHTLLSATVLAPSCAEADAFATSFMVMGMERAKEVLQKRQNLQVFFIYDSLGENRTFSNVKTLQ